MSMTGTLPPGWTLFGASFQGPSGTLQRARGPEDQIGVVVQFRPDMAHHELLTSQLDELMPFLQNPGVMRVLPLLHRDPGGTWFLYEIGQGRLLSELIQESVLAGAAPGERAAMELVGQAARILSMASEAGAPHGAPCHGDINPWRIVVDPAGQASLLGYGLPPVEVVDWIMEETEALPGPGFRYTVPEWLVHSAEFDQDLRSDLYGLGVVAAELALGHPLMEGSPSDLLDQIPSQHFWPLLDKLSRAVRGVLRPLLQDKPDKRPSDAIEVAREAQRTGMTLPGMTLAELMSRPTPEIEPGIPLPPLGPPHATSADTDPRFTPPGPPGPPVQSANLGTWNGDDPLGEESELVAWESAVASTRLGASPPPKEMPLLQEPEVPVPVQVHRERAHPDAHARPSASLLLLTAVNVDLEARQVIRHDGRITALSEDQVAVLKYLVATKGDEVTPDEIWGGALGGKHGSSASVRSLLLRLRELIERMAQQPDHLVDGDRGGFKLLGVEESHGPAPLPEPDGELIGRDAELEELIKYFGWEENVLATVVGPLGSGASQLALAAARRMQAANYEVHRVVIGGTDFGAALANSLGIRSRGRPKVDVLRDIGQRLHDRSDIIILLDAPRPHARLESTVAGWLSQAPRSVVIVVARSLLRLPGEKAVPLGPLPLEQATQLLRDRIEHHRPGAQMTEDTARAIVEYLDRMPVAIDAAAGHTAYFSPDALLDRLAKGVGMEVGEGGSAGMDANLAEILNQLDTRERRALEQLTVFEGGFDIVAAEAVVKLPAGEGRRIMLGLIGVFGGRSLLRELDTPPGMGRRWALFEIVRAYLRRNGSAEEQRAAVDRHGRYFAGLGLQRGAGPWVEQEARQVLVEERQNLRVALQRGGPEAAGAAIGLTAILGHQSAGALVEDVEQLASSLDPGHEPTQAQFWAASRIASARGHLYRGQIANAQAALREAASEMSALDVRLRVDLAWMQTELGSSYGAEAALFRMSTTDPWALAVIDLLKGRATLTKPDPTGGPRAAIDGAKGLLVGAREAFDQLGASVGRAHTQRHLAEVNILQGETDIALAHLTEAQGTFEQVTDTASALECRVRAAELRVGRDRKHHPTDELERVMADAKGASALGLMAFARGMLAVVHAMDGRHESAEHHFYLALASTSRHHQRIRALFALYRLLMGSADTALHEARAAEADPVARAMEAVLVRTSPPVDDEAYIVYDALETWRAGAPLARISDQLGDRASLAVRMVLTAPPHTGPGH